MEKLKVGVIGGTGMVGQRYVTLIANHPWFELAAIAASARSAGKTYEEAVGAKWALDEPMPECAKSIVVKNAADVADVVKDVDFVFSAVDMKKEEILALEEEYAKALSDAQLQQWANKNMRLSYEPGSTFKPVVVAAALEEGVIDDNSTFYCRGAVTIDNWTIRCSARSGHGSQSLRKAVMNSCNPALIDIGKKLGAEKFYEYWETVSYTHLTLPTNSRV